jgi:hypothetical protein
MVCKKETTLYQTSPNITTQQHGHLKKKTTIIWNGYNRKRRSKARRVLLVADASQNLISGFGWYFPVLEQEQLRISQC